MDEKELINLVYNHQYTDDEKAECIRIVQLLEKEGFTEQIGMGFPQDHSKIVDKSMVNSNPNLYIYIIAIKNEDIYHYYYIEYEIERSFFMDFQEKWLGKLQEYSNKRYNKSATPLDCFLYFLIDHKLDSDQRDNCETVCYRFIDGKCMRATVIEKTEEYTYEPLI